MSSSSNAAPPSDPAPENNPPEGSESEIEKRAREELIETLDNWRATKDRKITFADGDLHGSCRWAAQTLGIFIKMYDVVLYGSELLSCTEGQELSDEVAELSPTQRYAILAQFKNLLKIIPTLERNLKRLDGNHDALSTLISFLDASIGSARRDLTSGLRKPMINWVIRVVPSTPQFFPKPLDPAATTKTPRGFNHPATGRLLCPRDRLDEFDEDPNKFCTSVQAGTISVGAAHLPTFLWATGTYNPENMEEGLLKGEILVYSFRHLYTGPGSALKASPGPQGSSGRPSICVQKKYKKVTPPMIANAAVLARFSLCAQDVWQLDDGAFNLEEFFQVVVDLFDDPEDAWCKDTIDWWEMYVFLSVTISETDLIT
ncbi:hypothetical protein PHLGIDRAFT_184530 [Phlebiopsis gigantea 11061_1 CR5-6]|uniref:Uncharacterized protein n=1 Tax=Phlebiopsis gigantea (strain 11061_1 CR5-6) TaxID=745531 RepID=A0A0C3PTL0_PHLG1|nr:hypothetical protein PHLGIDRAFT_184530 [Phlebiopsis gigantea 11061_1 CR5-6]